MCFRPFGRKHTCEGSRAASSYAPGGRSPALDCPSHGQDGRRGPSPGRTAATTPRALDRGAHGGPAGAQGQGPRGRRRGGHPQAARSRQAHRARADRAAGGQGVLPRDRPDGPPPGARLRHGSQPAVWRRGDHRLGLHRRPQGVRVLSGLHGVRRVARRGHVGEGVQDHGPGRGHRGPGHRHQRLRRSAHPGGRLVARRVRIHLRPKRPRLGRRAADLPDHGAVRRRRGLLARHHRLHLHGPRDLPHVHHRSGSDQDRDR